MLDRELGRKAKKILGLGPGADLNDIKRAYWRLAMECHPDKNPRDKKAEERFKLISEAYEILTKSNENDSYCVRNHEESIEDKSYLQWWIERFKHYV